MLRSKLSRLLFSLFVLLTYNSTQLNAQKVALVLSGGGAKGLSHVGVLKALEEYNIPIDYIAGTSMGAVVGGLYASGFSPQEIESLLTSKKFKRWASGETDINNKFFYKKAPDNASWISLPINYDRKIRSKIPLNLVPTDEMDFSFMELFAGAAAVAEYNFDNLFIPFRCVATDVEASQSLIMRNGQLSDAIRTSMSLPFYISPIRVNGRLLFDGGMYNNFPVDVALEDFNPDIIIGSKAAANFAPPEEDDIVSQLQNMLMSKTDYSIIQGKGVLIEPDLGSGMNITDFSKAKKYIDSGYLYTVNNMERIESIIDRRSNPDSLFQKRLLFSDKKPLITIDSINIEGSNLRQSLFINRHIRRKDQYLNLNEFKREYFKLIADNNIKSIYPRLYFNPNTGFYNLNLNVKRTDAFEVEFGGNISSKSVNQAYLGLRFNQFGNVSSTYKVGLNFGRFYSGLNARVRIDYPSRLPYFLNFSFVLHNRDYFKSTTYFVEDKTPSFLIRSEYYTEAEFGIPITSRSRLSLGIMSGRLRDNYYQTNQFTRSDTTDQTTFIFTSPFIKFEYNTLNRKQYPNSGARHYIGLQYVIGKESHIPGSTSPVDYEYSSSHEYYQLNAISESYFTSVAGVITGLYAEVYMSNKSFFNNYTATILAANQFQPILESTTLFLPNYRAHNYFAFGIKEIFPINKLFDFRAEAYYFQPYRDIFSGADNLLAYYGLELERQAYIGSVALVYNTPIGPISIALGYYDKRTDHFSIVFNLGYVLFNRFALD
ncbi:MAG: hypothetical protein GY834_15665 [Bacteroidetes bacterium]|nr:hypothetical protein [Bacteroidota bacterium]